MPMHGMVGMDENTGMVELKSNCLFSKEGHSNGMTPNRQVLKRHLIAKG